jgi:hypothetical protein
MKKMKRTFLSLTSLATMILISSGPASAACNATINGRPMTLQECFVATQIYGYVIPGNYWADDYGNWGNVNNPLHNGNAFARGQSGGGGGGHAWGRNTNTVIDTSGGCEGGGCVNIMD